MTEKKYTFKAKYLVPLKGLVDFNNENPAPNSKVKGENRKYALRALPIAAYNLILTAGAATGIGYGIYKGIEELLK